MKSTVHFLWNAEKRGYFWKYFNNLKLPSVFQLYLNIIWIINKFLIIKKIFKQFKLEKVIENVIKYKKMFIENFKSTSITRNPKLPTLEKPMYMRVTR